MQVGIFPYAGVDISVFESMKVCTEIAFINVALGKSGPHCMSVRYLNAPIHTWIVPPAYRVLEHDKRVSVASRSGCSVFMVDASLHGRISEPVLSLARLHSCLATRLPSS